jgi:hypothetical protein
MSKDNEQRQYAKTMRKCEMHKCTMQNAKRQFNKDNKQSNWAKIMCKCEMHKYKMHKCKMWNANAKCKMCKCKCKCKMQNVQMCKCKCANAKIMHKDNAIYCKNQAKILFYVFILSVLMSFSIAWWVELRTRIESWFKVNIELNHDIDIKYLNRVMMLISSI